MLKKLIFIVVIAVSITACSDSISPKPDIPIWVFAKIKEFESEPVGNPPQSIFRYKYHGEYVFFIPDQCCDQFSHLYSYEGEYLGAPSGGFTGHGDGTLEDFFIDRTDEYLVWADTRKN